MINDWQENLNIAFESVSACRNPISSPAAIGCKADTNSNFPTAKTCQAAFAQSSQSSATKITKMTGSQERSFRKKEFLTWDTAQFLLAAPFLLPILALPSGYS